MLLILLKKIKNCSLKSIFLWKMVPKVPICEVFWCWSPALLVIRFYYIAVLEILPYLLYSIASWKRFTDASAITNWLVLKFSSRLAKLCNIAACKGDLPTLISALAELFIEN